MWEEGDSFMRISGWPGLGWDSVYGERSLGSAGSVSSILNVVVSQSSNGGAVVSPRSVPIGGMTRAVERRPASTSVRQRFRI